MTNTPSPPAADDLASQAGREIVRGQMGQSGAPVVAVDDDGKPRDRLGRIVLHKIGWVTWLRAIPGLADQFREIPETFWTSGPDVDGTKIAEVTCPCGVGIVKVPTCEDRKCEGCHRLYLYTGLRVLVAYLPTEAEAEVSRNA